MSDDDRWIEFDFVVAEKDRDRTQALLDWMAWRGFLPTNVVASRGIDLAAVEGRCVRCGGDLTVVDPLALPHPCPQTRSVPQ